MFIHRDPTTPRHTLWVADRDPLAVPVGPYAAAGVQGDGHLAPAPLGLDERGQLVTVPLMWNTILIARCRGRARRSPPGCWRCTRRWTRT